MSVYDYSIYSDIPASLSSLSTSSSEVPTTSPADLSSYFSDVGSGSSSGDPSSNPTNSYNLTAGQMLSNYAANGLGLLGNTLTGNFLGMGKSIMGLAMQDPTAKPSGPFGTWVDSLLGRENWTQDDYNMNTYGYNLADPNVGQLDYTNMSSQVSGLSDLGSYGLTTDPTTGISYGGYSDEAFGPSEPSGLTDYSGSPDGYGSTTTTDTSGVTTDDSGTSYGSYSDSAW